MERTYFQPTDFELEVLNILFEYGPSTVRFVNDKLNENRQVGYTTTLKIMQIMHSKQLVFRDEKSKSHIYTPLVEEKSVQNRLIEKILNRAFGGSASRLVMQTLGNHQPSREELAEIRKLLDKLDEKSNQ